MTLFVALMVPVMVGLGFWQLARGDEKAALAADFAAKQARAPVPLTRLQGQGEEALAYLPVRAVGSFRNGRYFLLDNRTRQGRFGNEVIAVFEPVGSDMAVLVNRGWIPADPARREAPTVPDVEGVVTIEGYVYVVPGNPLLLAEQRLAPGWPKRVQALEMDLMAAALERQLGDGLFARPVRLEANSPGALVADWQVVNVSPQRHTGYAVQWFAMAGVLTLIYIVYSARRAGAGGAQT